MPRNRIVTCIVVLLVSLLYLVACVNTEFSKDTGILPTQPSIQAIRRANTPQDVLNELKSVNLTIIDDVPDDPNLKMMKDLVKDIKFFHILDNDKRYLG